MAVRQMPYQAKFALGLLLAVLAVAARAEDSPQKLTQLRPQLKAAIQAAKEWQPDAALSGLFVKTEADGSIDLGHLARPPQFDGGLVSATFRSLKSQQEMTYTLKNDGTWEPSVALPINPTQDGGFIGEDFLDLDAALKQATANGLKLTPQNRKSAVDARITTTRNEVTGQVTATWTLTVVDMKQPFMPVASEPVTVAATTGRPTTTESLSGQGEIAARLRKLTEGQPLARNVPRTFDAWRKAATDYARQYRDDLTLYEVSLATSYVRQKFALRAAEFRFVHLSDINTVDGAWDTPVVQIDGQRIRLQVSVSGAPQNATTFLPRAVPDDVMPPETAMKALWKQKLNMPPDNLHLLLSHSELTPIDVKRPIDPLGPQLVGDPAAMPRDRWTWRTAMQREETEIAGGLKFKIPVGLYTYLDAHPDHDPQPPIPLLDPQLTGTWSQTTPSPRGETKLTWIIAPDATYEFTAEGPSAPPAHSGIVHGVGGRWTVQSTNANWEDGGTFRFVDEKTLETTGKRGKESWRREGEIDPAVKPLRTSPAKVRSNTTE